MQKNRIRSILIIVGLVAFPLPGSAESSTPSSAASSGPEKPAAIRAAYGVLSRITKGKTENIRMEIIPAESNCDRYQYSAGNGILTLRGSSTIALCRGFYDYVKANHLGQVSWAGSYLRIPDRWPDAPETSLTTPFEIRHAYNAVTPGYTFPYWTWERWEQELDWQAVHGFNMLMAPIATEAIAERVWLKMGLTQEEIDAATCGPAHMPWYRMGNICGIDGHLPKEWNADQIALQHKILARMRELGMEPVVQSFAGFVPRGFARLHPETKLHSTFWNGGLPPKNRPVMMLPDDPQFAVLTKEYMDAWKKEFGDARYFLVDSFNEMEIPKTNRPETELLADYGEKTWQAIHAANPNAVWAIQGWTFGYQNWKVENLRALFSKVPDDRMLVLDYANDYSVIWKKYQAFWGKHWVFGYVPNMGGKTAFTGDLKLYASASAQVLQNPERKNLKGFTISGEGLENNEVLYELLTDMAWSKNPLDLDRWYREYSMNRYGDCPEALVESWKLLRNGCYGNLKPHPGYRWQHFGDLDRNPNFYEAATKFLSCADQLKQSPAYRADAVEFAALALAYKADEWYQLARETADTEPEIFERSAARALELLSQIDRLMQTHPYHRMDRWIDFAKAHSNDPKLRKTYESNARCIVTYWANGVQNYSCRVWGGLVRDYYRERLIREFDALKTGKSFDANRFMLDFVSKSGLSEASPLPNPVADAQTWLAQAVSEKLPKITSLEAQGDPLGRWNSDTVTTEWKTLEWNLPSDSLPKLKGIVFRYSKGAHRLDVQSVKLLADGKVVAEDNHQGFAGKPNLRNFYKLNAPADTPANNSCQIRAIVKGNGGNDSQGTVYVILDRK